jgi:hypothetical protein
MGFEFKELKNIIKILNKAQITKNRIKISGGKDQVFDAFLNEMELIIDSGLSSNIPIKVVTFYDALSEEQEDTQDTQEVDEDDLSIWHEDKPLDNEEEEGVLIKKTKQLNSIDFDDDNEPIYNSMSVFANVMDLFLNNQEIKDVELMQRLKKRGIKTTKRYAKIRLKHAKDMFLLMEKRGLLKEKTK